VLDSHSNPGQPAWVTFFPMIAANGLTAGHGITAAHTTDPTATRANWYAYYNGSFGTQQQFNEGLDSPLPGLDGDSDADYNHYSLGNPSVHWNTALNSWVLAAGTWDGSKILISYSTSASIAGGWTKPALLYSAPAGTTVKYPTIVGTDHLGNLNDTESGADATLYWAQFDGAGVRSMQSAPLTFNNGGVSSNTTQTNLITSASTVNQGQSVTFTVTVVPLAATAVPTVNITFLDGADSLGVVPLGSTLSASLATSNLTAGTHQITAQYGGDTNYLESTSSSVTETVVAFNFSISVNPSALTVVQGTVGSFSVNINPTGGFDSPIALSCKGLRANSFCTFSHSTITPNGSDSSIGVQVGITTNAHVAGGKIPPSSKGPFGLVTGGLVLSCCFPFVFGWRKKRSGGKVTIGIFVLCAAVALSIAGCGGSSSAPSTPTAVTPTGTSTVTIVAVSGGNTQTSAFTLTVQ
jgi:hypothetical protein